MARPLFLSYRHTDTGPPEEVALLDRELRHRGVPVWRDVRDLFAGGQNETEARSALSEDCSGCVLYFTEEVLDSWFITSVELDEVRRRLERDPDFFIAAIFDGVAGEQSEALGQLTGVDPHDYQGLILPAGEDREACLREFSADLLRRYLTTLPAGELSVRADSWNEIAWSAPEPLQLNWSGVDAGLGHLPSDWRLLKGALAHLRAALTGHQERRLQIAGNLHLSAAFLLGWEFRETTGWTIAAEHPRAALTTAVAPADPQDFSLVSRPTQNDSEELVVCVCASADCTRSVLRHRSAEHPARAQLTVFPPDARPGRQSLDRVDLMGLAAAILAAVRGLREDLGIGTTHLFLACPWTLALALGWSMASCGALIVHEAHADKSGYHPDPLQLP